MSALAELFRPNPYSQLHLIQKLINQGVCNNCYLHDHLIVKLQFLSMHIDINDIITIVVKCPKCKRLSIIKISDILKLNSEVKLVKDTRYFDYY